MAADGTNRCERHPEKQIEYFCRSCHTLVCPKCMFADHNGHELATLAEVCLIVKQNIDDLQKLIMNTKRINEDNKSYVTHVQDNLQRLREN